MKEPSEHHLGEDLAAIASGGSDISAAKRAELEAHVAGCTSCQRALAETRMIFEALDLAPVIVPSPAFDRALFSRLDAVDRALAAEERSAFWSRVTAWLTPQRVAVAGVAAAVLALVLVAQPSSDVVVASDDAAVLEVEVAENLELLQNFEVVDNLDVIDDLDLLAALDEEEPG